MLPRRRDLKIHREIVAAAGQQRVELRGRGFRNEITLRALRVERCVVLRAALRAVQASCAVRQGQRRRTMGRRRAAFDARQGRRRFSSSVETQAAAFSGGANTLFGGYAPVEAKAEIMPIEQIAWVVAGDLNAPCFGRGDVALVLQDYAAQREQGQKQHDSGQFQTMLSRHFDCPSLRISLPAAQTRAINNTPLAIKPTPVDSRLPKTST